MTRFEAMQEPAPQPQQRADIDGQGNVIAWIVPDAAKKS